jgi:hypothetical protein
MIVSTSEKGVGFNYYMKECKCEREREFASFPIRMSVSVSEKRVCIISRAHMR